MASTDGGIVFDEILAMARCHGDPEDAAERIKQFRLDLERQAANPGFIRGKTNQVERLRQLLSNAVKNRGISSNEKFFFGRALEELVGRELGLTGVPIAARALEE